MVLEPAGGPRGPPRVQTAPGPQNAMTDGEGRFTFHDLLAGPYTVAVQASAQHMASMPRPVNVEPRTDVRMRRAHGHPPPRSTPR